MKAGLILEGGSMRGLFTAGILDVFMERNITFDGVVGVSAGALFGCNIKSRQIGRAIRYNKKYCQDPRYASIRSFLKTGSVFGVEFCYRELPDKLDPFDVETFENDPTEFYVVATDVETGKAVYKKCEKGDAHDIEWMRASGSVPMMCPVVEIDGYKLLDGGVADSIPYKFFEQKDFDKRVVILTQPKGYVKQPNKLVPLARVALRKYPKLIEALRVRHRMYNETIQYIEEKEANGEVFVIRPPEPLNIGGIHHTPEELERVYQIGRKVGLQSVVAMKKYLESVEN